MSRYVDQTAVCFLFLLSFDTFTLMTVRFVTMFAAMLEMLYLIVGVAFLKELGVLLGSDDLFHILKAFLFILNTLGTAFLTVLLYLLLREIIIILTRLFLIVGIHLPVFTELLKLCLLRL